MTERTAVQNCIRSTPDSDRSFTQTKSIKTSTEATSTKKLDRDLFDHYYVEATRRSVIKLDKKISETLKKPLEL